MNPVTQVGYEPGNPLPDRAERLVPDHWLSLYQSWRRALEAEGKKPNTVAAYGYSIGAFARYLFGSSGRIPSLDNITRQHAEGFMIWLNENRRPWTALGRYSANRKFFLWLKDEEEILVNPWEKMKPPRKAQAVESAPPVFTEESLVKLIHHLEARKDFMSRRDVAVVRFMLDTGARRGEVATMLLVDLDLKAGTAVVGERAAGQDAGKKRVARPVAFGAKTSLAIDRYLRVRSRQRGAQQPWLWLSRYGGRMTGDALHQMVDARCEEAGVEQRAFPHLFRHTNADTWMSTEGANEGDLMRLMGWESRAMLDRYGRARAQRRAIDAHKRLKLGDRY